MWVWVLVPLAVLVGLIALAVLWVGSRHNRLETKGMSEDGPTVRYEVPEGQDPVTVTQALIEKGYEVRTDLQDGMGARYVVVACPHGAADREPVRAAIASAGTSQVDPAATSHAIRFTDER
jgi:hypothetical protein